MIKKLLEALEANDETALAACFAPDGQLFDYCPCVNGGTAHIIYGREGIEMLYRGLFALKRLTVAEAEPESDNEGTFFGAYDGPYVFARVTIKDSEGGLIKKAVIVPG